MREDNIDAILGKIDPILACLTREDVQKTRPFQAPQE